MLEEYKSREEIQKDLHAQGVQVIRGYDFKDGHLELAWSNGKIKEATDIAPVVDTDGDGEEEMLFRNGETGEPVMLKGEREFF